MDSIDSRQETQPINLMMIFLIAAALLLAIVRVATLSETLVLPEAVSSSAALQMQSGEHQLSFASREFWVSSSGHALNVAFLGAGGSGAAQGDTNVQYSNLWPGIAVAYSTSAGGILRSTYTLDAAADPRQIALRYSAPVEVQASGALTIRLPGGMLQESAPLAWQEIGGERVEIPASFVVSQTADGKVVGFSLGAYDPRYPLVIDPLMDWLVGE
jgi:hypothetical protein